MEFSCKLFRILLVLLLPLMAGCSADSINQECSKDFKICSNSSNNVLQNNINQVFFDLIGKTSLFNFAISFYGGGSETIYGLTRCRGDVSRETCLACILDATEKIRTICPFSAEARIWYEYCFLHYDSNNFLGQSDTSHTKIWGSTHITTDPMDFHRAVKGLLGVVKVAAATREDKFGRGESSILKSNMIIYGMAQCTRDLHGSACSQCLDNIIETMLSSCKYRLGCHMINTSCELRYEVYKFLVDN